MSQDILNGMLGCLRTALEIHEHGARNTGRTERLLGNLRAKDVIVCGTAREAERLRRELRVRQIVGVQTTHAEPSGRGIMQIVQNYNRTKRFLFDHTFLLAFMRRAVDDLPLIFTDIEKMNERLSQQEDQAVRREKWSTEV